ncbi:hypothetical protein M911_05700 [Ectothiorhodospira haloalkaliphila]|uniref:N-acetyltransferase domain-containing protein n=1 Tax=Ectothiorhodospira haloalkaliphila TaxID=421628 RepID=W8KP20_9GAMM|nr:hypothetical protein M911_05700 [Ectothiorhodospira haloalkaliphila]
MFFTLRQLGWCDGVWFLLSELVGRLSGGRAQIIKYHLLVQPLNDMPHIPPYRGAALHVREVEEGDPLLEAMGRNPQSMRRRFQQGAHCLALLKHGDLVGYLWWQGGAYEEDEVRCLFLPQPEGRAVWDFDVFICPSQRLSASFAKLWQEAGRRLRERGFTHTCSRISAFNPASLSAHRHLGAHVVGSRIFMVFGGLEVSVGSQTPRWYVSRPGTPGPHIKVGPLGDGPVG